MPTPLSYADVAAILPLVEARLEANNVPLPFSGDERAQRQAKLRAMLPLLGDCLRLEQDFSGEKSAKTTHIKQLIANLTLHLASPYSTAGASEARQPSEQEIYATYTDISASLTNGNDRFLNIELEPVLSSIDALKNTLINAKQISSSDSSAYSETLQKLKLFSHFVFYRLLLESPGLSEERKRALCQQFFHEGNILRNNSDFPAQYLGLDIGRELGAYIAGSIPTERSKAYLKDPMSWFNRGRLYWVWGNTTITGVLQALPDWLGNDKTTSLPGAKDTSSAISGMSVYTGYLSFILYYARFAIELFIMLKNALILSEEQAQQKNRAVRLKDQWQHRKFMLLNDGVWATANMVCFFWLVGSEALSLSGDVLTVALLLMDAVLTIWRYVEEEQQYQNQRAFLQDKIDNSDAADAEKALFESVRAELDKNWQQKKLYTVIDIAYSIALLASFALHVAVSYTPAMKVLLGPMGAILCFSMGFLQSIVTNGIELHKINRQLAKAEQQEDIDYLQAMQKYQIAKNCLNFFVEASFPLVFYLAFTCLSGLAGGAAPWLVAAAFLIVTVALPKLLEPIFKPSQEQYKNRFLPPPSATTETPPGTALPPAPSSSSSS